MAPADNLSDTATTGQRYRFGGIVVDAAAHTLVRDGQPCTVEPKAFAVLLVLLRRAGELVGRDDLLDAVWGHRHVTPGVLTRAIAQLRSALADDFHHPIYIQTQHALGYRFIGTLQPEPEPEPEPEPGATPQGEPQPGHEGLADTPAALAASAAASTIAAPAAVGISAHAAEGVAPPAKTAAAALPETFGATGTGTAPAPAAAGAADLVDARVDRARRPVGWRWLAVGMLGIALAAAALWLARDRVTPPPAEASVAVLPFSSLSSVRDDRYFAEGLAVEMHDALAGVPGLKVVAARPAVGAAPVDARALGRRLGVATVLDASVRRDGARMRISARLSDTATGVTLWSRRYDRQTTDVFALQSEIAAEVVQALLGMQPGNGRMLTKRLAPTHSLVAYDAYLKGLQQLGQTSSDNSLNAAIGYFREALAADPVFARAQAGICRAEIARFEGARDALAFDRAQAACVRAAGMDAGLREVSLALGEMYRARGEPSKAIAYYNRALDDIALRPAAYVGLARTESAQGRNAIALDYFQRALALRPGDATIQRELGYHHYLAGDIPAAIDAFRTATRLQPDDEQLWSSLGGLYLANGDTALASEAFERSLAIKPNYGALSNFGSLKYEAGAYSQAADLYRHAAELDPSDFRVWGNIGDALSALPATAAQAREPYRRAAELAERYVGIKADDAQALGLLCWYRANLGEAKAARELLARAESLATERGEVAFWGAQALALGGDDAGARARVAQALAADIPAQRIRASPLLRHLTGDVAAAAPRDVQFR